MSELLLELFSEEIPARMQARAAEDLKRLVTEGLKARGLTTYDLGASITSLLGTDYVRNPEVAVEVVSYRPVFVIGEVRNAGQFSFQPGMTVETAVAVAGGYSPRANQQSFVIARIVDGAPAEIEASPLERVRPGDTVRVNERYF